MVCSRCVMMVEQRLHHLHIAFQSVGMGWAQLAEPLTPPQAAALVIELQKLGFDLVEDKKAIIVEKIKTLLIDLIQNKDNEIHIKYSQYLTDALHLDYGYLSALFSATTHMTIERYIILAKIERVKEYLKNYDLSLKEIAARLNYSSVQALSNQFHKVTDMSPSQFKELTAKEAIAQAKI